MFCNRWPALMGECLFLAAFHGYLLCVFCCYMYLFGEVKFLLLQLRVFAPRSHNIGNLVQGEHLHISFHLAKLYSLWTRFYATLRLQEVLVFLSLYHNCDSTTIRLRRIIDMFIFTRVEWKQVHVMRRSRIVVELQL